MKKLIFLLLCSSFNAQASTISDFSWIPSTPTTTASTTLSDGTMVTLESSIKFDDFRLNSASVFSLDDASPAIITLSFNQSITNLRLHIDDLDPSEPETLDAFSIVPTSVDGFLSLNSGVVTSLQEDSGGNIIWSGLNSTSVTFTFNRCAGCGLFLDEIEITAVPLPPAILLFGSGLIFLLSPILKKINRTPIIRNSRDDKRSFSR